MRIIIPNKKTVEEAKRVVEQSSDDLFRSAAGGIIQITHSEKRWNGNTMSFGFKAGVGFFTLPISGTVVVTAADVTIDVIVPEALRRFIAEDKLKTGIETRIRALLS